MSKVKYRVREFTPKANQGGAHSWFAEAVIDNDITNNELAKRIAARTGFSSPAHLSHAFKTAFGLSPRAYRLTTKGVPSR